MESLKRLQLKHLRLRVDVLSANPGRESPPPSPPLPSPPPCVSETSAARVDVPAFLRELCDAVPTLVDAYIVMCRRSVKELQSVVLEGDSGSGDVPVQGRVSVSEDEHGDDDPNWARVPMDSEADVKIPSSEEKLRWREMFELDLGW